MPETAIPPPGFEVGPIRPPSEALSLLVRVTRNCPYNRCAFCPVYKGQKFSLRSVGEVKADIDAMAALARRIEAAASARGGMDDELMRALVLAPGGGAAVQVAEFLTAGGRTAFLQDANSLIMPVDELCELLRHLRQAFPSLRRVSSYARSHTVRQRTVAELERLREAGLSRVHIGLESGSDRVLELVSKGATAARHVEAGLRVKEAGLHLCEYVMPGLGGKILSEEHALETARVLRAIDPHFIRLRTVTIPAQSGLAELCAAGRFEPLGDIETVHELRLLLSGLEGVTSSVRSDHILNLLEEVSGKLPEDLPRLLGVVDRFLGLAEGEQVLFMVGRRLGALRRLEDLDDPASRARAQTLLERLRSRSPGSIDAAVREIMARFV